MTVTPATAALSFRASGEGPVERHAGLASREARREDQGVLRGDGPASTAVRTVEAVDVAWATYCTVAEDPPRMAAP